MKNASVIAHSWNGKGTFLSAAVANKRIGCALFPKPDLISRCRIKGILGTLPQTKRSLQEIHHSWGQPTLQVDAQAEDIPSECVMCASNT